MARLYMVIVLGGMTLGLLPVAGAQSGQNDTQTLTSDTVAGGPQKDGPNAALYAALPPMPALPSGRSTVIGGVIRSVDPVRDQMTLDVFGGRPMKILFDERTQVYLDGKRTALEQLRPSDHASVQTVLDGTDIFAESVHMLTHAPQGQTQGQVINYDPTTGRLTLRAALSQAPIVLNVQPSTSIAREGQPAFTSESRGTGDLKPGALVTVAFQGNNQGGGIADQITILATPGSSFVFTGTVAYLDLHDQELVVQEPGGGNSYKISFNPALFPASRNLHEGSRVTVKANFNGSGYVANDIRLN